MRPSLPQLTALVASTILDLIRNMRAFGGILVVSEPVLAVGRALEPGPWVGECLHGAGGPSCLGEHPSCARSSSSGLVSPGAGRKPGAPSLLEAVPDHLPVPPREPLGHCHVFWVMGLLRNW